MPPPQPLPCPVCAALVWDNPAHLDQHTSWHLRYGSTHLGREDLLARFAEARAWVQLARDAAAADDDAPTAKLPPIRESIRRRPPAPDVRDLTGPELLHALARALEDDEQPDERCPACSHGLIGWHAPQDHPSPGACTWPGCACVR